MSKYTEAETKIKKIMCEEIDRLPSHFDGEDEVYDSAKDADEILKLNKIICKALQIADRLEQADFTKHKKHYHCNIGGSEWDSGYEIGFINGYSQALADIRGEYNE